jgi:hypothetical protein
MVHWAGAEILNFITQVARNPSGCNISSVSNLHNNCLYGTFLVRQQAHSLRLLTVVSGSV